MSIAKALLAEFEEQVPITRSFLERVPNDRMTWKPHEKSWTAGQLALHIAIVPGAVARRAETSPSQVSDFSNFPQPENHEQILKSFDESIATVRTVLASLDDKKMHETWRLVNGSQELLAVPRLHFLRNIMLNHWYQHRGQLSVYLRILNVPVPASWGPSADEPPAFAQMARSA